MNAAALPAILYVLLIFSTSAKAQRITGKVLDTETQKPLAYVHVSLQGNQQGTVTDEFGNFSLEISEATELRFSSIGYITYYQQLNPASDTSFTVFLIPDTHLLSEVFVYSKRINILERSKRAPIEVAGLPSLDNPQPLEPGMWKWNYNQLLTESQIGGKLYGPFSYFTDLEKQKRKMKAVNKRESALKAYHTTLEDEGFRQEALKALSMTPKEYDSLLILFNQHHTDLVANKSRDEAMTLLFLFLQEKMEE